MSTSILEKEYYIKVNDHRLSKNLNKEFIVVTGGRWRDFARTHFVHCMEYFYYASDIIINTPNSFVILIEPPTNYISPYVTDFIKMMYEKFDNFIFTKEYKQLNKVKTYIFDHDKYKITDKYIINKNQTFIEKKGEYYNWFPNRQSSLIRDLFIKDKDNHNHSEIKIGLVNRKINRILENSIECCEKIYEKFGINVCVTDFEDKTFEEQINFFYNHDIIISPHGAQLCSIPFLPDNGLVIECVHEEWHPYYFFSGLSFTSRNYHAVICDNHDVFPKWSSPNFKKGQQKLNIKTNIDKVINVIDMYIKNKTLEKGYSYLF